MDEAFDLPRHALDFITPWMNAAGSLGFRPPREWNWPEPQGAFVTNPISPHARTPAGNRAFVETPGGFLLHSGLPNPGLNAVLREHAARWERASLPVWVHLLANSPDEVERMARRLENSHVVAALEIGLPPEIDPGLAHELIAAAAGELPVAAHLDLAYALADPSWVQRLARAGAGALVLGAPRGSLPLEDGLVAGRMYGRGFFPLVMEAVRRCAGGGLPLIAGCGVFWVEDGQALLKAGAAAIQLDAVLWG